MTPGTDDKEVICLCDMMYWILDSLQMLFEENDEHGTQENAGHASIHHAAGARA